MLGFDVVVDNEEEGGGAISFLDGEFRMDFFSGGVLDFFTGGSVTFLFWKKRKNKHAIVDKGKWLFCLLCHQF